MCWFPQAAFILHLVLLFQQYSGARDSCKWQVFCFIPPQNLNRAFTEATGDGEYTPSPASLSQHHWYCSQNRISTVAAWARVASPWGVRVLPSPVPLMIPAPQAHWRAETAYSDPPMDTS